ncbi:hypothetical protein FT663_01877 [Candidozyma haemuli var. vulneris]|uniref:Mitochondrial intermembrane space import and assembly protein 40 n=1 Tax=Candidozyma haemuli TaxID=45357 RepID=A0A2V1ANM0_9ASCO|nr:hypothetical protein CXQ85_003315 [[Candida] haemuloni]KAF3993373.1 hypothetical protein FT663_01877 [[Candida] haemuloni var. vulneris]KAF3993830.1 hypothetical protein FT662_00278 [[Candida] haemuloni var. vulneris]PVH19469.1 hypothetical protein CXQ85_003315 [[Candida] haemuloni]
MFRTVFSTSLRQGAILSRRFASSGSRTSSASRIGLAPRLAAGASLLTVAVLYPLNQISNDVKEQAEDVLQEASEQAVKKELKVAADESKTEGSKVEEEVAGATQTEGEGEPEQGQAAFNPETGEINWDCPCLGGMAHGPCGEEFKEAFACFVYSETEPKGIDCIKKFEAMRTCFKQHPEHYKEELYEDEEVPSVDKDSSESGVDAATTAATTAAVSTAGSPGAATTAIPSEGPSHASSAEPSAAPAEGQNAAPVASESTQFPAKGPSHAVTHDESQSPHKEDSEQ